MAIEPSTIGRKPLRALLALALAAASGTALAAPSLRKQVDQHGDFVLFGNSVAQDCATGVPAPLVGTVGACGSNVNDTGADVFWQASDTGASASTSISAAQARSTAILSLPPGAAVTYARLYWGAMLSSNSPDTQIDVDRPAVAPATVTADRTWSVQPVGGSAYWWYQSTADVTALVQSLGPGAFRVGGIASVSLANLNSEFPYAGWWMAVFYELPSDPLRNLALFDGFDRLNATTPSVTATLSGFQVPNAGYQAKLGVVAYDGDLAATGDSLNFYRSGASPIPPVLSDAQNPASNFFNGTRSMLGSAVSVAGDLPQLAGTAGSMVGLDLDVVDVSSRVQAGDTAATIVAATSTSGTTDAYVLSAFVTSVSTLKPDFIDTTKSVENVTRPSGVLAGDTLRYTITATNTGSDASVNTLLLDTVPAGVSFVAGSVTFSGPNGGADYDPATRTLTARVGTGATSTQGGSIAVGGSFTVSFDATVDPGASGTIANSATVSASGQNGNPQTSYPSHPPGGSGASPTPAVIDQCLADGQCAGGTPFCLVTVSPRTCVACLDSSACDGATPVCDPGTHACVQPTSLAPATQAKTTVAAQAVPFSLTLANHLSGAETYDLSVASGGCGFAVELLADAGGSPGAVAAVDSDGDGTWESISGGFDSNSNGAPDLGPTPPNGGTTALWLRLTPPAGTPPGASCTATLTARGATSGLVASAAATALVGVPVTFTPDHTFAQGTGKFVASGGVVWFPGVVQNNGATAQSFALTAAANPPVAGLVPPVFYSDPNGDGDPADGTLIYATPPVAPFGGTVRVVLAVTASATPGGPLPVGTAIGIDARAGAATQRDEAAVGLLTSYSDPARALATQRFAPCATAYVRADGLAAGTPYALYWFDRASPVLGTDAPVRTASLSSAAPTDSHAFPAAAAATWTLVLADLSGGAPGAVRDTLVLTVERSAVFASLGTGAPRYALGSALDLAAEVRNDNAGAPLDNGNLRYVVGDEAGTLVMDPSGAFLPAPGTTRIRAGLSVPAGATAGDSFTAGAPGYPSVGRYQVYAEWQLSCAATPLLASAVAGFEVVPPPPQLGAPAPGATVGTARPSFSGTGLSGATVTVTVDGAAVGATAVTAGGEWTLTASSDLAEGAHTATALQALSGFASDPSAPLGFSVDTVPPSAPSLTAPASGLSTSSASLGLSGDADATAVLAELYDGAALRQAVPVVAGAFGFTETTPALSEGAHLYTVRVLDAAGNRSAASNAVAVAVDRTAPAAPSLGGLASPTNAASIPVTGAAEPGATVRVYLDGALADTVAADGSGAFASTLPSVVEGPHQVTAVAIDAAGNAGPASAPGGFAVDRTPPVAPGVTVPADGAAVGAAAAPGGSVSVAGAAEADASVDVEVDGAFAGAALADASGAWSLAVPLLDGAHLVRARAADAAGNSSGFGPLSAFTLDTAPPSVPTLDAPGDGAATSAASVLASGAAEPGAAVRILLDGAVVATATADAAGAWQAVVALPASEGPLALTAVAVDSAGNASPQSAPVNLTVDRTAPAAPALTSPAAGASLASGAVTVAGSAEPGATVSVSLDGGAPATTVAAIDGSFSLEVSAGDGGHTLTVTATDAAGNASPPASRSFTAQPAGPPAPPLATGCSCGEGAGTAPWAALGLALLGLRRRRAPAPAPARRARRR